MYNFDTIERKISELQLRRLKDDRFITAHYYVEAAYDVKKVGEKVASHQSTAASVFSEKNLLDRCSAKLGAVKYIDKDKRKGVIAISFPVELFGSKIYSGDILHIVSGAVQNDESEHRTFYLIDLEIPEKIIKSFPGPQFGTALFKSRGKPMIGTIIKPCSGITIKDYERIVSQLIEIEDINFIKEDENLFPGFKQCPLNKRVEVAAKIIEKANRKIVFAPHISAHPLQLIENINMVAEAGLSAVMFSETYYGGMFREARDYIKEKGLKLAIYAHNGGICTKTKNINRVLLDYFARLDGADLRQTAPSGENCYLRPLSWQRDLVEESFAKAVGNKKKTVSVRAGGLDQGNLLNNLYECNGKFDDYLFLMGSAINSIKNKRGKNDPKIGVGAVKEVISLFNENKKFTNVKGLYRFAQDNGLSNLVICLKQKYKL